MRVSSCAWSTEQRLRRQGGLALLVVAEAICKGLEHREGLHVGLLLRRVDPPRRKGNGHVKAGLPGGLLDADAAAQDDEVRQGDPLAALLRALNSAWISSRT